jgi:hypothetical protein
MIDKAHKKHNEFVFGLIANCQGPPLVAKGLRACVCVRLRSATGPPVVLGENCASSKHGRRAGELHGGANRLVVHEGRSGAAVVENGGDRETAL